MLKNQNIRFGLFCIAICLYAVLGSPTPDDPGWIEGILAFLLISAAGLSFIPALFFQQSNFYQMPIGLAPLFLYGLSIPVMVGLYHGANMGVMIRDIIAFLFLCLPLFLTGMLRAHPAFYNIFMFVLFGLGTVFAARVLGVFYGILPPSGELLYLANSPIVLLTALYFIVGGFQMMMVSPWQYKFYIFAALALGGFVMAAMLLDVQRAMIGAVVLTLGGFLFQVFMISPRRIVIPVMVLGLIGFFGHDILGEIITSAVDKTARVGFNMRLQDMRAVFDAISDSTMHIFFGLGWGGEFISPAVGGVLVPYTHSLLTYMLLKTGLIGMVLTLVYLGIAVQKILIYWFKDVFKANNILSLCFIFPLLIPVFLYASYKSFDFGLLLLSIYAWEGQKISFRSVAPQKNSV